jgi:biopolymer transport protein TolR
MNRSKPRALLSEINVVPYIDVTLVLLVIFMITGPLLTQGVVLNLPDVAADPVDAALDEPLIFSVDRAGAFYLNFGESADEPLDEQAVLDRAAAVMRRDADTPILVRADDAAVHGRVMKGIGLLRQAGVQRVIFAFDPPEDEDGR